MLCKICIFLLIFIKETLENNFLLNQCGIQQDFEFVHERWPATGPVLSYYCKYCEWKPYFFFTSEHLDLDKNKVPGVGRRISKIV